MLCFEMVWIHFGYWYFIVIYLPPHFLCQHGIFLIRCSSGKHRHLLKSSNHILKNWKKKHILAILSLSRYSTSIVLHISFKYGTLVDKCHKKSHKSLDLSLLNNLVPRRCAYNYTPSDYAIQQFKQVVFNISHQPNIIIYNNKNSPNLSLHKWVKFTVN